MAVLILNKLSLLSSGGMVPAPRTGPGLRGFVAADARLSDEPAGLFPWVLLEDPVAMSIMGSQVTELLEISQPAPVDELIVQLGMQKSAPVHRLAEAPEGLRLVAEMSKSHVPSSLMKQGTGTKGDDNTGDSTPLSPKGAALLKTILDAFKHATFSGYWWGYKITLNAEFASAFPSALFDAESPLILQAIHAAFVASGFWTSVGAAAAAVGGWITAGILIYGLWLAAEVMFNRTPRGVRICGIWETLIPLWAEGV